MSTTTYQPGDILLVNDYTGGSDLLGNLIRAGERARYGNVPDPTALGGHDPVDWTHSALIVSVDGDLVEALAQGIARSHISKYDAVTTKIVRIPATAAARRLIVQGALMDVGLEYNRIDFLSLAIKLLFGTDWGVSDGRADICSEYVSRYTEKAIPRYQFKPGDMTPADLDVYYGAAHGQPLSLPKRWLSLFQALYWAFAPWKHGVRPL